MRHQKGDIRYVIGTEEEVQVIGVHPGHVLPVYVGKNPYYCPWRQQIWFRETWAVESWHLSRIPMGPDEEDDN